MKRKLKVALAMAAAGAILATGAANAIGGGVSKTIKVVMNGVHVVVDGQTIFDENILYNGTTYVPVRALAESLGKGVKWDAETGTVEIGDKDGAILGKNGIRIYAKTVRYKDEYAEVKLAIPAIEGMNNAEEMDKLNREFEKKALEFKTKAEAMIKESAEEAKTLGFPVRTGSVNTDYEALLNDNGTMSISVIYYLFAGGAHGDTCMESVNLDAESGRELLLEDLFDGSADYKQVLTEEILKKMRADKENLFPETLEEFKATDDLKFYLTNEGIAVYFNPYEVGPHSSGIVEYVIPYDSLKDVLDDSFAKRVLNG